MSKLYPVAKMTKPEIEYLLYLISVNQRDGWFFALKEQYWKHSEQVKNKLLEALPNNSSPQVQQEPMPKSTNRNQE